MPTRPEEGRHMTDTTTLEQTKESATTILDHWVDGGTWAGASTPHRARLQPRVGHGAARGAPRLHRRRRRRRRLRDRGVGAVARLVDREAPDRAVRVPRAAERAQAGARRDPHLRARQGALRRARRDRPRHGGRRVRVRPRAPHEGRVLRERLDRRRRVHGQAAARGRRASSARSTSPRWCRSGSSRSRSRPATP